MPEDGSRLLDIKVQLADDVLMPAVRALMVFHAVAEHGELAHSVPDQEAVEGFTGHSIRAWVVTQHEEAAIAEQVVAVSDVADVEVTSVDLQAATAGAPADAEPAAEPAEATAAAAQPDTSKPETAKPETAKPDAAKPKREPGEAPTGGSNHQARTVRVDAERLDALMHSMGELVIHRTAVEALTGRPRSPGTSAGRSGPDPLEPSAPGDGHAGPDDPRRHRLHALPAPRP